LYTYSKKKYPKNIFMRFGVGAFIAVRLPVALAGHVFRIN